jgi:dihydroorotase
MSNIKYTLCLKNGQVMINDSLCSTNVYILDGSISVISDKNLDSDKTIDCTNLTVLPGVIDSQVHFREPGLEGKETLESGMLAAASGGVTSIFEMPNTNPLTITPETIQDKLNRASKGAWTDYAFYLGGTMRTSSNLSDWENLKGVCGIKIFMGASTGDLVTATDEEVESVVSNGRRVIAVHAEDQMIMDQNQNSILGDSQDVGMHCKWRSPESCLSATTRVVNLARKHNRRVHILHITTEEEMEFLSKNKDVASVELLANHLTLHAPECYERLGTLAQQNPPIRERKHQDALWAALNSGVVDIVASDHAPHTLDEKSQTYPKSPSGTPGVQTLVPIMLNHVNNGKLALAKLVGLWSYGPERIHKISNKGRIKEGYDADFTIVDMNKEMVIKNSQQRSKSKWTPYDGMKVKGWVTHTILRGNCVMQDDEILAKPIGQMVKFKETI